MRILYKYIGNGSALIPVPTRDLTEADFEERKEVFAEMGITEAVLIASGLYENVDEVYAAGNEFVKGLVEGLNKADESEQETKAPTKKGKAKKEGE
jgi:hypothetical protein